MQASLTRIGAAFFSLSLIFAVFAGPAGAQDAANDVERRLIVTPDADYFGGDFDIRRDVSQPECEAACLEAAECRAFTYNVSSRWCFLKNEVGELRTIAGAVAGRVVDVAAADPDMARARLSELDFLPRAYLDAAERYAAAIAREAGAGGTAAGHVSAGNRALAASDARGAAAAYRRALSLDPDMLSAWPLLAGALAAIQTDDWRERNRLADDRVSATVNAYLRARTDRERAATLSGIGAALAVKSDWKPVIRAYRASLALLENGERRAVYERVMAQHGFRLLEHRVDSDAAAPQICLVFSDNLAGQLDPATFVSVSGGRNLAIEAASREICITGVEHGERYAVTLRAGLPAADGERLERSATLDIFVRDRQPSARFTGTAYVLPGHDDATIPLATVNTDRIEAKLYRIGDRALARTLGDGRFLEQLNAYQGEEIGESTGVPVWSGTVDVERSLNRETVTAIPVAELVQELEPGAYVIVASTPGDTERWQAQATQWFIVTDIGLSTLTGVDGFRVATRSLTTAAPLAGVALRLVARNNEVLGTAATDETGMARFDAGLVRGTGGLAPALVVAETGAGDYSFLDLTRAGLDLTDRGVEGRDAPGPVDMLLVADRGVYRPGETAHATLLVRDATAVAIDDLPVTLIVSRPDGKEASRQLIDAQALGGSVTDIALAGDAMRGSWRIAAHLDPSEPPLAEATFLVEDFLPERLDFDISADTPVATPGEPLELAVDARFLYGAPAAGLDVSGRTTVVPVRELAGHAGFRFGLADEDEQPYSGAIDGATTDDAGAARLVVELPSMPAVTRPRQGHFDVELLDTGGRPVERRLSLPIAEDAERLGLRPLFDGAAGENSAVSFQAIAVAGDGARIATDAEWTLSRVETDFQWYRSDGRWNYETITRKRRVASGTLAISPDGPATIRTEVAWGGYELAVSPVAGDARPASIRFEAGWYVAPNAFDSPEALKVSLDAGRYRVGDMAQVHVEPPFAGKAHVMVIDNRLIDSRLVDVPAGGATIAVPVTAEWGPGAYVTVAVYRPMDVAARLMPARAIGLAWASVDPAERLLEVAIEADDVVRPRQTVPVTLSLPGLAEGGDAYVTLAAIDAGILNLTGYEAPSPDGHYFGQRRLGVEIRDFYNQLIDRMQGAPGRVRSGGDASPMRFEGPPPPDVLMAFHSGLLEAGPDGTVTVDVPVPDFNGTVRLMVMAWSKAGVGHAVRDIVARDPLVVTASLPRFMAPGDRSRLLLDIANVEGLTGEARIEVIAADDSLSVAAADAVRTVTLSGAGRTALLVPVTANRPGAGEIAIDVTLPDGTVLSKSLPLGIQTKEPAATRLSEFELAPGASLTLDGALAEGFVAGTGTVTVSAGAPARLDLAGIVSALDRYPYGCSEQLTSRALPLVYLNDVILAAGLAGDTEAQARVSSAIDGVLAHQSAEGSFGLWGPGYQDVWLDAYVTDFLSRARDRGFAVPDVAFGLALDNLQNRLSYVPDFDEGGEHVAYALYVLARHGRAAISDIRYYAGARLESFSTPLGKAQLAAALALYGDRPGAERTFRAAIDALGGSRDDGSYRSDYGSALRDNAAILTLVAESGTGADAIAGLADRLAAAWARSPAHSTQEQSWTLLAANALMSGGNRPDLSLDGLRRDGPVFATLDADQLAAGATLTNHGTAPVFVIVTARGVPEVPEPAGGSGTHVERAYYSLDGQPADPAAIGQGDRLVAVLTAVLDQETPGRFVIDDPLPAGFEIDNPNLIRAGELAALDWLEPESEPAHVEFRADRFIAAVERIDQTVGRMQFAYIVRAVSPGRFAHPAAIVEDMYRPERHARTASGFVEIVGPLR